MPKRIPRRLRTGWNVKFLFASATRQDAWPKRSPTSDKSSSSSFFTPGPAASFPNDVWEDEEDLWRSSSSSPVFDISQRQQDQDAYAESTSGSFDPSVQDDESTLMGSACGRRGSCSTAMTSYSVATSTAFSSSSSTKSSREFRPLPPVPGTPTLFQHQHSKRPFRVLPSPPSAHRPTKSNNLRLKTSFEVLYYSADFDSPTIPQTAIPAPSRRAAHFSAISRREDNAEIDWSLLEEILGAQGELPELN